MNEFETVRCLKGKGYSLPNKMESILGVLPNTKNELEKLNINFAILGNQNTLLYNGVAILFNGESILFTNS